MKTLIKITGYVEVPGVTHVVYKAEPVHNPWNSQLHIDSFLFPTDDQPQVGDVRLMQITNVEKEEL